MEMITVDVDEHEDVAKLVDEARAAREAFRAAAGSWKGFVDDDFVDRIYRERSMSQRPVVRLDDSPVDPIGLPFDVESRAAVNANSAVDSPHHEHGGTT